MDVSLFLGAREFAVSLPFLREERVRLLGRGADPHPHLAHGPFAHSALENWHPAWSRCPLDYR